MNTVCSINLYEDGTEKLYEKLCERLQELELIFDVNNSESEISKVNAAAGTGNAISVSRDFANVLEIALKVAEETDGAFNPSCGPLVKLWGINTDHAKVPADEELEKILPLCDYRNVIFTPATNSPSGLENKSAGGEVSLSLSGMSLDLGGIVKGYAADELVSILKANNVKRAILDLGGNIYVYGQKKDKSPWKVGVKNPDNPTGEPKLVLECSESSIVTSGVYERFFEQDGKHYHHIIDCKTGRPVENGIASLTIICGSSLWADVLSTTLFVMGEEKIEKMDFERFTPEFEYIIIMNDGEIIRSRF